MKIVQRSERVIEPTYTVTRAGPSWRKERTNEPLGILWKSVQNSVASSYISPSEDMMVTSSETDTFLIKIGKKWRASVRKNVGQKEQLKDQFAQSTFPTAKNRLSVGAA